MRIGWELNKKHAFTLAEVLITLGIIGVVAAMTIPTLVQSSQKTQFETGLKKAYSQMNQVLLQMASDNGTPDSIADYFGAASDPYTAIASHFKVIKNCGWTQDDTCFAKCDDNYDGSAHATVQWDTLIKTKYKFVTVDGMSFAVGSYGDNCTSNRSFAAAPDAPANSVCGALFVDINGTKKPNYLGRDVFVFYTTSGKSPLLYPLGGFYVSGDNIGTLTDGGDSYWNYHNNNLCGGNAYKGGMYCSGRIMGKGWKMDY